MRFGLGKLLNCALLAAYASIALLGEGLHALVPHGHHSGDHVVECTVEHLGHCACWHHRAHEDSKESALTPGGGIADCHTCEICEFLFQAVGEPPTIAATPDLHPLVADLLCAMQGLYSPTIPSLHAARGPPQRA